jgi:hypothetical protein
MPTLTTTPTRIAALVAGHYSGKIEWDRPGASGAVNLSVTRDGASVTDQLWLLDDPEMPPGPRLVRGMAMVWDVPGPWPLEYDGRFVMSQTHTLDEDLWEMVVEGWVEGGQAGGTISVVRHSPLRDIWNSGILSWSAKRL